MKKHCFTALIAILTCFYGVSCFANCNVYVDLGNFEYHDGQGCRMQIFCERDGLAHKHKGELNNK